MKGSVTAFFLALSLVVVPAIGAPASVSPAGRSGFLYTNNNLGGANTVSAYSVAVEGGLVPLVGSPYSTGGTGDGAGLYSTNRIAVSPTGSLLYVGNEGSRDVSVFSINRLTGQLSLVPGSPFATGTSMTGELGLVPTPDNRFLMVTNFVSNQIAIFSVAGDGSLTAIAGSPFALGGKPGGMKITSDGKFLAMTYVLSNIVAVFAIASNGTLTSVPGSPFALYQSGAGDMGTGLEIDCSGRLLFVDQVIPGGNSAVEVFTIAGNGALSRIAGSPFQAGAGLNSNVILLSRDGHKLFLSNQGGKAVTVFEVATDGALVTISGLPFAINQGSAAPMGMASVAAGNFLFTGNNDSSITTFSVAAGGALTLVGTQATGQPLGLQSLAAYPAKPCSSAVPHIQQPLIPQAIAPAGTDITLTLDGTGFLPASVVAWNGTALTTTFISPERLSATLAAAGIASDHTATITVANPVPGGGVSSAAYLPVTTPTTTLRFRTVTSALGDSPVGGIAADFNRDRKPDLVVLDNMANTLSVLLGNGNGTFQAKVDYATGASPVAAAVGDFNRDGYLDLAVSNANGPSISILLGNGDGTFHSQVAHAVVNRPGHLVAGDFNADGNLDLAIANSWASSVTVLLGKGDGSFQPEVEYTTGSSPFSITMADFDRNGTLDLAVAAYDVANVSVLLGYGDGTFQSHVDYATGNNPNTIIAADFNGDAFPDLAVTNSADHTVSILLGTGSGSFLNLTTLAALPDAVSPAVADLNGDGKLDLVYGINASPSSVSIYFGNADGTFQDHFEAAAGAGLFAVADFDGDGRLDLATASNSAHTAVILRQAPRAQLDATGLIFASEVAGIRSAAQTVVLSNHGSAPLAIASVTLSGAQCADFSMVNSCGATLSAGASCGVAVRFTPSVHGSRVASLAIATNAEDSPHTVSLAGTGTDFSLAVNPASGSITAGQSTTHTLTLAPLGEFAQTVSLSCTGAPMAGSCSVAPSSLALPGSGSVNATLTVQTTAPSIGGLQSPVAFPPDAGGVMAARIVCLLGFALLFSLCALAGVAGLTPLRSATAGARMLAILVVTGMMMFWAACGGDNRLPTGGTPAGQYTVTVTGTYSSGSSTMSHNATVTVTVN